MVVMCAKITVEDYNKKNNFVFFVDARDAKLTEMVNFIRVSVREYLIPNKRITINFDAKESSELLSKEDIIRILKESSKLEVPRTYQKQLIIR